jgi:hypothetical protein
MAQVISSYWNVKQPNSCYPNDSELDERLVSFSQDGYYSKTEFREIELSSLFYSDNSSGACGIQDPSFLEKLQEGKLASTRKKMDDNEELYPIIVTEDVTTGQLLLCNGRHRCAVSLEKGFSKIWALATTLCRERPEIPNFDELTELALRKKELQVVRENLLWKIKTGNIYEVSDSDSIDTIHFTFGDALNELTFQSLGDTESGATVKVQLTLSGSKMKEFNSQEHDVYKEVKDCVESDPRYSSKS